MSKLKINFLRSLISILIVILIAPPSLVLAGPEGEQVVNGSVTVQRVENTTNIHQSSSRAIVNWNSFDINKNELVDHRMPDSNSAALHRVVGGQGASQLEGTLRSNGNIYLVNPKGVVIHNGAKVETNSFLATTSDISNDDFMANKLVFDVKGDAGGVIKNDGQISVKEHGFAALVAPKVQNDGVIAGRLNKVALTSADKFKLDVYGDDLVSFTVTENQADEFYDTDGVQLGVENTGKIKAEGGIVLLTANQLDKTVAGVVNNSGVVDASSAVLKGGRVVFSGADQVEILNSGIIDVSSDQGDGGYVSLTAKEKVSVSGQVKANGVAKGGQIDVVGQKATIITEAQITAVAPEDGLVRLGGEFQGGQTDKPGYNDLKERFIDKYDLISLKETENIFIDEKTLLKVGDNGIIIVWSNDKTILNCTINGKYLEISGHSVDIDFDKIQLNDNGTLLLDPDKIQLFPMPYDTDHPYNYYDDGSVIVGIPWLTKQLAANNSINLFANDSISVNGNILPNNGSLSLVSSDISINKDVEIDLGLGYLSLQGYNINIHDGVDLVAKDINIGLMYNSNIYIGENTKFLARDGDISFQGKSITIMNGSNIQAFGTYGQIDFVRSHSSNGNGNFSFEPFESITLYNTNLHATRELGIHATKLFINGSSLYSDDFITLDGGGYVYDGNLVAQFGNYIDISKYNSKNSIISSENDISLRFSSLYIEFDNTVSSYEPLFISNDIRFYTNEDETTLVANLPAGQSLSNPLIHALEEIEFKGSGTYFVNPYSIFSPELTYDDRIKFNGLPKPINSDIPHIFGVNYLEKYYIYQLNWEFSDLVTLWNNNNKIWDGKSSYLEEQIRQMSNLQGKNEYLNFIVTDSNISEARAIYRELLRSQDVDNINLLAHQYWFDFALDGNIVAESEILEFLLSLDKDQLNSGLLYLYVWSYFNPPKERRTPIYISPIETITTAMDSISDFFINFSIIDGVSNIHNFLNIFESILDPSFRTSHWSRSNDMYYKDPKAPETVEELYSGIYGDSNDWQKDSKSHSGAHNLDGKTGNISYRYIGEDEQFKGYQFVYDNKDILVTEPANMGSLDISSSSDEFHHFIYDMLPWILYGNTADDKTTCSDRLDAIINSAPGYIDESIGLPVVQLLIFMISGPRLNISTKVGNK
jgi:filamentous hemagglutinin family protein